MALPDSDVELVSLSPGAQAPLLVTLSESLDISMCRISDVSDAPVLVPEASAIQLDLVASYSHTSSLSQYR